MWMCDEAYFASPDLDETIRHIVDVWYIVTDEESKAPVGPVAEKKGPAKKGRGGKKGGHTHGKGE
jgi:hypothetical protein